MVTRVTELPTAAQALPGREESMVLSSEHYVHGRSIVGPFGDNMRQVLFGMGCFWGVERRFWSVDGVFTTAVGYVGGYTPNPTYEEVCTGMTGHNEVVLVVYDPDQTEFSALLKLFWESHDPTQGMRQGNDMGSQYRSGIYCESDDQLELALASQQQYQHRLEAAGFPAITTEIKHAGAFFYAEDYHQQYLAKNPHGYCNLMGTGVPSGC